MRTKITAEELESARARLAEERARKVSLNFHLEEPLIKQRQWGKFPVVVGSLTIWFTSNLLAYFHTALF